MCVSCLCVWIWWRYAPLIEGDLWHNVGIRALTVNPSILSMWCVSVTASGAICCSAVDLQPLQPLNHSCGRWWYQRRNTLRPAAAILTAAITRKPQPQESDGQSEGPVTLSPSSPGGSSPWPQAGAALWPSPWTDRELHTHTHRHTHTHTHTHTQLTSDHISKNLND